MLVGRDPCGSCVTLAYLYGLETMALTEKQEMVQVCENNWIRRIVGVKRVEVGVEESFKKTLVRSGLNWAGHVGRMGDEKLATRADAQKVEGKRRRGRPRM